jgi:outer membrane immunogenic protein
MKNLLLFFIAMIITLVTVQAQTERGGNILSGAIIFTDQSFQNNNPGIRTIQIAPFYARFIRDNLSIGGGIGFTQIDAQFFDRNEVFISPVVRKYKRIGDGNFFFYAQARATLGFEKNFNVKATNTSFQLSPGLSYFMSNKWALELYSPLFNIMHRNPEGDNNNSTDLNFGLSTLSPGIMISFYF